MIKDGSNGLYLVDYWMSDPSDIYCNYVISDSEWDREFGHLVLFMKNLFTSFLKLCPSPISRFSLVILGSYWFFYLNVKMMTFCYGNRIFSVWNLKMTCLCISPVNKISIIFNDIKISKLINEIVSLSCDSILHGWYICTLCETYVRMLYEAYVKVYHSSFPWNCILNTNLQNCR